jgi:hypothetical protein
MHVLEPPVAGKARKLTDVPCCICGADAAEPIAVGEDFEYRTSPDTFQAVRRQRSGLVYLDPRPHADELDRIYPPSCHAFDFSALRPRLPGAPPPRGEPGGRHRLLPGAPAEPPRVARLPRGWRRDALQGARTGPEGRDPDAEPGRAHSRGRRERARREGRWRRDPRESRRQHGPRPRPHGRPHAVRPLPLPPDDFRQPAHGRTRPAARRRRPGLPSVASRSSASRKRRSRCPGSPRKARPS